MFLPVWKTFALISVGYQHTVLLQQEQQTQPRLGEIMTDKSADCALCLHLSHPHFLNDANLLPTFNYWDIVSSFLHNLLPVYISVLSITEGKCCG